MKSFGLTVRMKAKRLSKTSGALRVLFCRCHGWLKRKNLGLQKSREGKEGHTESPSAANRHKSLEVYIEKAKSSEYFECIILFRKKIFHTCTYTQSHTQTHIKLQRRLLKHMFTSTFATQFHIKEKKCMQFFCSTFCKYIWNISVLAQLQQHIKLSLKCDALHQAHYYNIWIRLIYIKYISH